MSKAKPGVSAEAADPPAPVCYRHPDRQTWVACTRCGHPICPDCMRPASVGFQCPACVSEGKRGTRAAATIFGGAHRGEPGLVTKALIGVNVAVWLLTAVVALVTGEVSANKASQLLLSGGITDLVRWGAATPVQIYANGSLANGIADGQFWRLITACFLHYGIIHLALNMYALWLLGRECEALLGRWRFLALYLISGVGGTVAEFLFRSPGNYAVGASGCIFGLMAAMFFFFRAMKVETRALLVLLLLNLGLGLFIVNISVLGHLGGLVVGGVVGLILAYAPRDKRRTAIQVLGMSGVVVVLASLVAIRVAQYGLL